MKGRIVIKNRSLNSQSTSDLSPQVLLQLDEIKKEVLSGLYLRNRQTSLDRLVRRAHDMLVAESAAIFLVREGKRRVLVLDASYTDKNEHSFAREVVLPIESRFRGGLTGHVAALARVGVAFRMDGETLQGYGRVSTRPDHLISSTCYSVLVIPLFGEGDRLLGLLKCENKKKRVNSKAGPGIAFDLADERIAMRLATVAVQVIQDMVKFEAFRRAGVIEGEAVPQTDLLKVCFSASRQWYGFREGIVYTPDYTNQVLRCHFVYGCERLRINPDEFKYRFNEASIATHVFNTQKPYYTLHIETDPLANKKGIKRFQISGKCVGVPLIDRHGMLGVLVMWKTRRKDSRQKVIAQLSSLGELVGSHLRRLAYESTIDAAYHSLLEPLPVGIFHKDIHGRIISCNDRYCALIGKPFSEIRGKTDLELFPDDLDQAKIFMANDRHVMTTGEDFEALEWPQGADGRRICVHVCKRPLRNASEAIIGVQGVFLDFSHRMQTQALQLAQLGSWEWNTRTAKMTASDELFKLFGLNPTNKFAVPESFLMRVDPEDRTRVRETLTSLKQRPHDFELDFRVLQPGRASRWLRARGITVDEGLQGLMGMRGSIQDITDKSAFEKRSIESEKLQALGRLAGAVAHDIRGHLTKMKFSIAELRALPELKISDQGCHAVGRADENIERIMNMVDLLTKLSAEQKPTRRKMSLNTVVRDILNLEKSLLSSHQIQIQTEFEDALPDVDIDPVQISSLLMNVIHNAIEAMGETKVLFLRTRAELVSGGEYSSRTTSQESRIAVILEVEDRGCGISTQAQKRLFQPGFTTKSDRGGAVGGGTGLGLYSCKHIIAFHDAEISIRNNHGKPGATVTVRFRPARKTPA